MLVKFLDGSERDIANLSGANLSGANLRGADLRGADLRSADLSGADLRGADLRGADLRVADLRGADLRGADLRVTDLSGADLRSADLSGADLSGADLRSADLRGARGLRQFVITTGGELIGYKKVGGRIITLRIPAGAKRVNAYGSRKCRAEYAYVLAREGDGQGAYGGFSYPESGRVDPDSFDPDPRIECSHGIHFFITREEAENY